MSEIHQPNMQNYAYNEAAEFNHFILRQNWTSGILREEAALLNELVTGNRESPNYVTNTETQREFQSPNEKYTDKMKKLDENRHGRYAHSPNQGPPTGILPTFNAKAYPEVIPRFNLPKMPF